MGIVAVNASVGHQTEQMKSGIILPAVLHRLQKFRNLKKIPVLDGFGNTGQLLVNHTAGTHIQMAHLGVTHLSLGKSHGHTAGIALHEGALAHELIHNRRPGLAHRIVLAVVVQAVAVKNHQYCRFLAHIFLVSFKMPVLPYARL